MGRPTSELRKSPSGDRNSKLNQSLFNLGSSGSAGVLLSQFGAGSLWKHSSTVRAVKPHDTEEFVYVLRESQADVSDFELEAGQSRGMYEKEANESDICLLLHGLSKDEYTVNTSRKATAFFPF